MKQKNNRIISLFAMLLCCLFVVGCANTTDLESLMEFSVEDESYYTPASYEAYQQALTSAQELIDGSFVFQDEIDDATNVLRERIARLLPRADKSALLELTQEAEDTNLTLYIPISCISLGEAIAKAKLVIENQNALDADVEAAMEAINQGLVALTMKPDKTGLADLYDEALNFDTTGYLENSITKLESALQGAKAVIDNENATEEDVCSAIDAIVCSLTSMELIPDKTELISKHDECIAIDTTQYLSKSVIQFTKALDSVGRVIEDENATESDVQAAVLALDKAIAGLDPKPDKTKLNNLIEKAENLSESKYTTASYRGLQNAINSVKAVQSEPEATQKSVDNAIMKLQGAIDSLKKCTSCVWEISVSLRKAATNHVGNEWSSGIYYNGERVRGSFEVTKKEGATITITGKAVEDDSVPDVGYGYLYLTLTDENEQTITFYVYENRGRYSGNAAVWVLEANCKLIERI